MSGPADIIRKTGYSARKMPRPASPHPSDVKRLKLLSVILNGVGISNANQWSRMTVVATRQTLGI